MLESSMRSKKWKKEHPEKLREWALRDREKNNKRCLEYYHKNKELYAIKSKNRNHAPQREYSLKKRMGIGLKEYTEYVEKKKIEQNNKCAICGCVKKLGLDHEHITNKLRGLLCHNCNVALGLLNENITSINNMLKYLDLYATSNKKHYGY